MTNLARLKNDGWVKQRFIRENKKTVVPVWYPKLSNAFHSRLQLGLLGVAFAGFAGPCGCACHALRRA